MAQCEVCGNNYDKSFEVMQGGTSHTFDSFECAIHLLAPTARTATARSWGTASKRTARSTAARIVRRNRA